MSNSRKIESIESIVVSLTRVKKERPEEYKQKLSLYLNMRDGGDGGNFRKSNKKMRELHFKNWKDSDFQILLEKLGETPVLTEEEREQKFSYENTGFFSSIKNFFHRS